MSKAAKRGKPAVRRAGFGRPLGSRNKPKVNEPTLRPGLVRRRQELAQAFDVTEQCIHVWVGIGMPIEEDGTYDIVKVAVWKTLNDKRKSGRGSAYENEQMREKQLKNAKLALGLRQLAGELVERRIAIAEQQQQNSIIRTQLEAFPHRLAQNFPPGVQADVVVEASHQVMLLLRSLSLLAIQGGGVSASVGAGTGWAALAGAVPARKTIRRKLKTTKGRPSKLENDSQ